MDNSGDEEAANAAVPEAGRNVRKVMRRRHSDHGDFEARSPPGRPRKYDDNVCARAVELLQRHHVNLKHLLSMLEDEGLVVDGDRDTFSLNLRKYCKKNNLHLNTTCRATTFMVLDKNKKNRVLECTQALAMLQGIHGISLRDIVFIDETQCDSAPHQKSTSVRHAVE